MGFRLDEGCSKVLMIINEYTCFEERREGNNKGNGRGKGKGTNLKVVVMDRFIDEFVSRVKSFLIEFDVEAEAEAKAVYVFGWPSTTHDLSSSFIDLRDLPLVLSVGPVRGNYVTSAASLCLSRLLIILVYDEMRTPK